MTRKHFRMIAEIISKIENPEERKAMAEKNAIACKKSNPRFDRTKFLEACNVK
jgi:hypothetical protein